MTGNIETIKHEPTTDEIIEYVKRCKTKDGDELHETLHAAYNGKTLCGKELNEMWFILSSAGQEPEFVTCRACHKTLKEKKWI